MARPDLFILRGRMFLPFNMTRLRASIVSVVLLVLGLATAATAVEVAATRLDGTAITGELRAWNDNTVVIAAPAGDQRIGTDQLISLRWQTATEAATGSAENFGLAELVDESIIPINSLRVTGRIATLSLSQPGESRDNRVIAPTAQLAAVRFQKLAGELALQWDDIRRLNAPTDLLAVLKRDGKSLDYVGGVIGDVSAEKIEFKLEGEPTRVDRSKVAGIVYYRKDRPTSAEPRIVVHGRSGLRASAANIELNGPLVKITTTAGAKLVWPIDDVELADFSAGKLMYLSDIEPASQRWTPLVGLPAGVTLAAEYGQPRRDRSAYGGPLTLAAKDGDSTAAVGATRSFNKGLALRSRTEIVYRVPAGFRRFIATAGIDPATSASGNVRLAIYGDDRPLLETDIAGNEPPRPIELEIANVKRLKIVVDFGQNLDTGDWLNLCDARIVK